MTHLTALAHCSTCAATMDAAELYAHVVSHAPVNFQSLAVMSA